MLTLQHRADISACPVKAPSLPTLPHLPGKQLIRIDIALCTVHVVHCGTRIALGAGGGGTQSPASQL